MKVFWVKDYRDEERAFYNNLTKKEQLLWERGVDYAVRRIKNLSWKDRLFKRFY